MWNSYGTCAKAGDLIQLVGLRHKTFIFQLIEGGEFQTHRGVLKHDDIIGLPWGSEVLSHQGSSFFLLKPTLGNILENTKRNTQILYPKDIGFILINMGIGPGMFVLEAGTGSGAFTTALAYIVGPEGRVISYEVRPEMQLLAQKNLRKLGLETRVTFKLRDIKDGFDENNMDALFLDVQNPYDYMAQVRTALKSGGQFGTILPTANQVTRMIEALRQHRFAFVDVCEILLRHYRPVADRFRPVDRMVAHTGFLVFARPIISLNANGIDYNNFEDEADEVSYDNI